MISLAWRARRDSNSRPSESKSLKNATHMRPDGADRRRQILSRRRTNRTVRPGCLTVSQTCLTGMVSNRGRSYAR
jgi:hypothetical protein